MTNLTLKQSYVSCSCNRCPNIIDWGKNNLICYGSCNAVVIWNPLKNNSGEIEQVLSKHEGRVNSVRWIPKHDGGVETELISGSADSTLIVWSKIENHFVPTAVLKEHKNVVSLVDAVYTSGNNLLIASASVDSDLKLSKRTSEGDLICFQTISLKGVCTVLRLYFIVEMNIPLLAIGESNSKISLFTEQKSITQPEAEDFVKSTFEKVTVLTGHEDWVRGLDIVQDGTDILLASSSQDTFIRLWRISPNTDDDTEHFQKPVFKLNSDESIQQPKQAFSVPFINGKTKHFSLVLESILSGHDGWVYGISWSTENGSLKLLSSSLDKTMIIWCPDPDTGVWTEQVRVGDVGGNTLGFYGCKYSPSGKNIIGNDYQGAFHFWNFSVESEVWEPGVTISGHYGEVADIGWEPHGQFLLSVSTDQTTRLHAPWIRDNVSDTTWHEIARPQVHGYDMSCLAVLSRYRFVSGAEEKVLRVFEAPVNFIENFHRICKIANDPDSNSILTGSSQIACGASVPSLGLSNKAVYGNENTENKKKSADNDYPDTSYFTALTLTAPPTEENLIQNTLWPEIQKLYGHGFELYALATTSDEKLIASACKATSMEHASIILWDTSTWQQLQKLMSHTLTVTQLAFSPDNTKLLSVSRDRRWSIFEKSVDGVFELVACTDKKTGVHSRIIWCCSWSHDSKYFITGSRDGKAVVWSKTGISTGLTVGEYGPIGELLELKNESVTAVAFAPRNTSDGKYLVALGLDTGVIKLYSWSSDITRNNWHEFMSLDRSMAHHLTVRRLAFQPISEKTQPNRFLLGSCGSDHIVRIYDIQCT